MPARRRRSLSFRGLKRRFPVASGSTYVTDFDWEWMVVGEYDGLIKYGRLCMPGESIADAVIREKLREDEIRDTGPRVVRCTWNDLERIAFTPRLHRRLAPLGLVAA
ncbi:hypothetical protein QNM97_16890 [Gordonia sp. L191]|uniref:hypothetical protein n=1 Tax=Gordonia sp. L191 TaxID=2982699 RepID=UPI0024BF9BF8|nr:hypothetical protein [Gordonia sp. L191]WHU45688.1 hypothetical protein QNM97_16890 [Gordonia sp. L191]